MGDPLQNVKDAIAILETLGHVLARSKLYRTKPWGLQEQADFVNAAVLLDTQLSPRDLLARLKKIETQFGRKPSVRWGPRTLDLDLLTYDDRNVDDPDMTIPHPRLYERAFVLIPLADIDERFRQAVRELSAQQRATVTELPP